VGEEVSEGSPLEDQRPVENPAKARQHPGRELRDDPNHRLLPLSYLLLKQPLSWPKW